MFKDLTYTIRGISPLILHNGQTADPSNPYAKALKRVSSKRMKTDADHEEMSRIEWMAGLYLQPSGPCVTGMVLEACCGEAAKKLRKGPQVKAGLYVNDDAPLLYDGPRDPEALWELPAFRLIVGVRVQRNRVMRTRPIFQQWGLTFTATINDELLNPSDVRELLTYAGKNIGLCDWRPKFGRFTLEE